MDHHQQELQTWHGTLCLAKWSLALAQDAHIPCGMGWVCWLPSEYLGNVLVLV